jgi:hypothetical protein
VFLCSAPLWAVGGIVVGFAWYERKCGLLSDNTGKRAAEIRFELDDVVGRRRIISDDGNYIAARRKFSRFMSY